LRHCSCKKALHISGADNCSRTSLFKLPGHKDPDIGDATLGRQLFTHLEKPIALVPVRLDHPQGYSGELGYPGYQMLPHLNIGDTTHD